MKQERLSKARGMSTLEILLALVVLTSALSAVVVLVFDNRIAAAQATQYQEALGLARNMLIEVGAQTQNDFGLIQASTTKATVNGVVFTTTLVVSDLDLFIKQATSTVTWKDASRTYTVSLLTLFTDAQNAQSNNTCSTKPSGDGTNIKISTTFSLGAITAGNPVTFVAAFKSKLYVSASNTSGKTDDLYIFDIQNPQNPTFMKSIDANTVTAGSNGLAVSMWGGNTYLYLANAYNANWNTCSVGPKCSQVQVLQVTNSLQPVVVSNVKIPSASVPFVVGSSGQGIGNTVTYSRGLIYVGLTKTSSGPEFVIYDVGGGGTGGTPLNPKYIGSFSVGRGVSGITVQNGYAYLSTSDNTRELIVLDVREPSTPTLAGVFNAPGSAGFGGGYIAKAISNKVYFGRNYVSNAPEFYLLDVTSKSSPQIITSLDVGTATSTESINGLFVQGSLTTFVTSHFIQVWNMSDISHMFVAKSFNLQADGSTGTALGCEGNTMYVGAYRNTNDQGILYILSPS